MEHGLLSTVIRAHHLPTLHSRVCPLAEMFPARLGYGTAGVESRVARLQRWSRVDIPNGASQAWQMSLSASRQWALCTWKGRAYPATSCTWRVSSPGKPRGTTAGPGCRSTRPASPSRGPPHRTQPGLRNSLARHLQAALQPAARQPLNSRGQHTGSCREQGKPGKAVLGGPPRACAAISVPCGTTGVYTRMPVKAP